MSNSNKDEDIIVTAAELGLDNLKPKVKVEMSVEEAQQHEIKRLNKLIASMQKDMEDRNDLMKTKILYESMIKEYEQSISDILEAFDETQFDQSKLSTYSSYAIDHARKLLKKPKEGSKNEQ